MTSTGKSPGDIPASGQAEHGSSTEVNWKSGDGRQPYQNKGAEESGPPNGGDEFASGDRGAVSGNNLDQLEQAKRKP